MLAALLLGLASCSNKEDVLRGPREDARATLQESEQAIDEPEVNTAPPIRLHAQITNPDWTHRNGSPQHRITNPALKLPLTHAWSASIGSGNSRKNQITASPVVAGGQIFTLDSRTTVSAHSISGALLWNTDLTPPTDQPGDASGGALAVAGGRLFVTTGFGTLFALDPENGAKLWEQKLDAAMTGGVTVAGGIVYTVSRDGRAWALNAADGRVRWEQPGVPPRAVIAGGASPAVTSRLVVFPFGTGDVVTMLRQNGIRVWQAGVSGGRVGVARSSISDITGDPVIEGNRVYVANQAGKTVAFDLQSGTRLWTAPEGALGPVWPAGGSLFLVSDDNKLMRLDADTGARIWEVELPGFVKADKRSRVWVAVVANYGPILAGGRLIVASSDGLLRLYDPVSGKLTGSTEVPGGAASAPVVAGGRLYVVSQKGDLHAFQ